MNWKVCANAPAVGTRLATIGDLPHDTPVGFTLGGGKDAFRGLIVRLGDRVKAYVNRCPHYAVPLNRDGDGFYVLPDNRVMCVVHCAVFGLEDGICVDGPVRGDRLMVIPVAVKDDGSVVVSDQPVE